MKSTCKKEYTPWKSGIYPRKHAWVNIQISLDVIDLIERIKEKIQDHLNKHTIGFASWLSRGLHKTSYGYNSLFYADNLDHIQNSIFLFPPHTFMFLISQFTSLKFS